MVKAVGGKRVNIFGEGEAPLYLDVSTNARFANGRPLTQELPAKCAAEILVRHAPLDDATLREIQRLLGPKGRVIRNRPNLFSPGGRRCPRRSPGRKRGRA